MARDIVRIDPYQAASELPTVIELRSQIAVFKPVAYVVGAVTGKHLGREASKLEDQLEHIVMLVDSFYSLLGKRNWVLHESPKNTLVEEMVGEGLSPEQAERRLIEHYKDEDNLGFYVRRVACRSDMAGRRELIERAKDDYFAGRYDAAALRLITVLDGFVNDFNKSQRCGLASRKPDEMVGFDCLGGHYLGLSHAVEVFQKSCKKLVEDEVYEVYRHGIVHGMVVNYNNDIVASKAWNYLFAVCDWADSFEKKKRLEGKQQKTLGQVLSECRETQRVREKLDAWEAHTDYPDDAGVAAEPWDTAEELFDAFAKGNVGRAAELLCRPGDRLGDYIAIAKQYIECGFEGWRILRVEHLAAARATCVVEINWQGKLQEKEMYWLKVDQNDNPVAEFEEGRWVLTPTWQRL